MCTTYAVKFQKLVEKEQVCDFLAGLNTEYDPIRIQVLGKVPFPSLEEAYTHVQQEESRRDAMYTAPVDKVGLVASSEAAKGTTFEKDHLQ